MSSPPAAGHSYLTSDSPPREPLSDQVMAEAPDSPPADSSALQNNTGLTSTNSATNSQINGNGNGNSDSAAKVAHSSAGSSWNNKKFQEEYQRAENQLMDQAWDHKKYGDPLIQG